MKRLKYYLLQMPNDERTYKELYEGTMTVVPPNGDVYIDYDNTYWYEDISFTFSRTHKLALDKPTVICHIPIERLGIESCDTAMADHCLRSLGKYIDELNDELDNRGRPVEENGKFYVEKPGSEVLVRNSVFFGMCEQKCYENGPSSTVYIINDGILRPQIMCLNILIQVQLPRRKIRKAIQMLCRELPYVIEKYLLEFDHKKAVIAMQLASKQSEIREWLKHSEYCAFIANGSILPRAKGTQKPLLTAVPFQSPKNDEIEISGLYGMGIKRGVTVITGGGYSGKSTLLDSIAAGIYNHYIDDGREFCITEESSITITAEDGRCINRVNLTPFINGIPNENTSAFSTEHASGSISQAANVMEGIDSGAKLFLIDEDRSATNFMIRDSIMKKLVMKETITPYTDRVQEMYQRLGVSTILVIGGSSEYLNIADTIYLMEDYRIHNVTKRAKTLCLDTDITNVSSNPVEWHQTRRLITEGFTSYPEGSGSEVLNISDLGYVIVGNEKIDIRGLHDIVCINQINALGFMLRYLEVSNSTRMIDIKDRVDKLYNEIQDKGIDFLYSSYFTTCSRFLALPRKQELLALISRMRRVKYLKDGDSN